MGALAVVERNVAIQIALQLFQGLIEHFAESHCMELFLYRAMEAFAEAVGLRRTNVRAPVLDLLNGQVELEGSLGALGNARLTHLEVLGAGKSRAARAEAALNPAG